MSKGLSNLNETLFDQLARLNDPELEGEALESEIKRAQSVTTVSKEIVANARLVYDATKMKIEFGHVHSVPKMLEAKD
ncbi:hypothetical protein HLV39_12250 [Marinobacter adhaerens]|uniref:Phage protein n=1 Tax=Marinobacter adhaerens TaxID=1033846 RepID=A0A851HTC1_9GAMM|nr:hypothetical protein [Marinobacter adhaerens]NWN92263.1 hypothetical protein [Marinobacter adhaerens]